ncbi:hypothetical protein GCM10011375_12310 [Hymenobacter qilianensis]|uniref:Uncharacterized protein n=2 Tax=Hymenobacter qilianensis TaxID=1385715 RepID=A0ACB5PP98_9BACT|nr:hypothetical protein [Hymenobacter qilianensis]QNP53211.1 hypothetical protein H9L05_06135 [Hymenobacter qilianensis]GGF58652.1 hypothetical protein GCM10011375_12310 [Hymenobacter qilianensis]
MKHILLIILLIFSAFQANAQRYDLGDQISPDADKLKLLGISSETNVSTYKYIGTINENMFGRKIGDIIVGVKNGRVVTTIYNIIPLSGEKGVPKSFVDAVQKALPFPLAYRNGVYGVNIDNESIAISRVKNMMTFDKDRIVLYNSIKASVLRD